MKNPKSKIQNPNKSFKSKSLIYLSFVIYLSSVICHLSFPSYAWRITKELEQEIKDKQKLVELYPASPEAHFELAITYAYTNYVQEGWDELKKVNEIDPEFKDVALMMYRKKVTENPIDWKLRFRLAFALYFNGMKEEAIRELERVIAIDPKNVWAYGYIGLIYGEVDNVDKAIEYVKKGIAIDYDVAALHLLLASGYYKKGRSWDGFWSGVEALRLKALGY